MSHPVYLLNGESFLAREALERIRSETGAEPLSDAVFDPGASPAEILGALETPSLLGGRRLIIVNEADALKKDQVEAIAAYLESPSPSSVLVLVASGRTKLQAAAKKKGTVVSLDAPRGRALVGWSRRRAADRGLVLDERGGWALIDAVGSGLRDLDGALAQLATGFGTGARVGAAEVRRMFPRLADERVYQFTDAVGERRLPAAMIALRRLLDRGDEPLMVFGALSSHVKRLLVARRYVDAGPQVVGDALGLPDWWAKRVHRQARSYVEEELIAALSVLAETDVEMKGGDLSPELALERAVLWIVEGRGSAGVPGRRPLRE